MKRDKNRDIPSFTLESDDDKGNVKYEVFKETVDPKSLRKLQKISKRQFFEDNNCKEINPKIMKNEFAEDIQKFDISNYDAWVVQCPKNIDPTELINKRIKMPGRRYLGNLQVRATHYPEPVGQTIGYVNERQKYTISQIPVSGVLMLSKRLNQHDYDDDEAANQNKPKPCKPQKQKLPVRHPFFGRDYKSRINVENGINKRLRNVESTAVQLSAQLRKTANFYKIRKVMQATTQSLEEKEQLVRQSVLTGVRPNFMSNGQQLLTLNSAEKQKPKKRKADDTMEHSDDVNDAPAKPKGKKRHLTEGENDVNNSQTESKKKKKKHSDIPIDLTNESFEKFKEDKKNIKGTKKIKKEIIDLSAEDVPTKSAKKNKANTTAESIVDVSISNKKQKKKKNLSNEHDIEIKIESDCDDVIKVEPTNDDSKKKSKKKKKTNGTV